MMRSKVIFFCGSMYSFLMVGTLSGQVFLQLERKFEVKAYKYGVGDILHFQATMQSGDWQRREIEQVFPAEKYIVFTDGYVPLDEIYKVQIENKPARMAGYMFTAFGAGWVLFGGIAHVATPNNFGTRDAVIGGLSLGLGSLLTHVISKKVFTIGPRARLRIVDTRFPIPGTFLP
jgi:hypothetical protein